MFIPDNYYLQVSFLLMLRTSLKAGLTLWKQIDCKLMKQCATAHHTCRTVAMLTCETS